MYVRLRNNVAHPHYHLAMPPDSARAIRDLAEIINRLWGHPTPGGRLYPAPLTREPMVIAWRGDPPGHELTIMRAERNRTTGGADGSACHAAMRSRL